MTVYRAEIVRDEYQESYEVETRGHLHLMPRSAASVWAIFGRFERLGNGHLLYTMGSEHLDTDQCSAHYLDDLSALRAGKIEVVDRIAA